jgi:diguanylate cyclase (GGDEF)-like protein/PAS domain S-box-containing protein
MCKNSQRSTPVRDWTSSIRAGGRAAIDWLMEVLFPHAAEQRLLSSLLATTLDHMYVKDRKGRFRVVSASLARSFGRTVEEVIGRTDFDFFDADTASAYRKAELQIIETGEPIIDRLVKHTWPGQEAHETYSLNSAIPLWDKKRRRVILIWGTNKDVTAATLTAQALEAANTQLATINEQLAEQTRRANEMAERTKVQAERVEYLAYHDVLTGLPNRSLFSRLLNQSISEAQRYKRQLAVAFIDIDRFKQINDTLGHEAGDRLLREVATRIKACVRDCDTVGRLGGDEFVVLVSEMQDGTSAATVAQKILALMAAPFTLISHEFRVTASIGISVYPQNGLDEQTLTKNADIAMYAAKGKGRNNFQFYAEKMNAHSLERLALESSLRHALERREFCLFFQAKRGIGTGCITGVEALLRWNHPDLGTVSPMQFIPVAEETGLIVPIGKWVLRTACLQNVAWQQQGLPPLVIGVNLTAKQFADERLVQDVTATLEATGMDSRLLELGITESLLIRDVGATLRILTALKALGIRIAVDDFGTGYSSLATLQHFPVDTIKIDPSFIREITGGSSQETGRFADAIIAIGKSLSATVVAQGVETKEQAEFLNTHACDELQGFYFQKPLPTHQFTDLLLAQSTEITYAGNKLAVKIP